MRPNLDSGAELGLPSRNPCALTARGFLGFLQGLYAEAPPEFRWLEDVKQTSILIKEGRVQDPAKLEKTPAILVQHGEVKWVQPQQKKQQTNSDGSVTSTNQMTFSVTAGIVGKDVTMVENLGWAIFGLVPEFQDLMEQETNITILGSPVMVPQTVQGSDNMEYSVMIVQFQGAVFVSLQRGRNRVDGVFDIAVKRARMGLELDGIDQSVIGSIPYIDMKHVPQTTTDLVLRRGPGGQLQVLPPADITADNIRNSELELPEEV